MTLGTLRTLGSLIAIAFIAIVPAAAWAQRSDQPQPTPPQAESTAATPTFKPPPRGAPGGRTGGATRSAATSAASLPVIELLAPADQAGITVSPDPAFYFYISSAARWPMQFTISAPLQAAPVIETTIPSPSARGIYAVPLAAYRIRLQPGIVYTWSVSVVLDPHAWSRNVVASAGVIYDPGAAAPILAAMPPMSRAAVLADAGVWYDTVDLVAKAQGLIAQGALGSLMRQVGLSGTQ